MLLIFAASRVVTTGILLAFAAIQPANPWTAASPGYLEFANLWDGRWYQLVAHYGYPAELPLTDDGHVAENAWAFMPVYPFTVRAVMFVTGAGWELAAVAVSVVFAAAGCLVIHRLMVRALDDHSVAFVAVAVFCFGPLSPILQVAYAESMHVFLLGLALLLVLERRYLVLLPVIVIMAFTRPSGLAFAMFLVLHVAWRWWRARRGEESFELRERWSAIAAVLTSGAAGLAWPGIVWAATGSFNGYVETELAWRAAYIGYQHLVPFTAWVQSALWWVGWPLGVAVLVLVVAVFALVMLAPQVRRLGVDLRLWIASYGVYLLAVFFPQSSTFRLLLPMFPLVGAIVVPRSRLWRAAVIIAGVVGQVAWVHLCWWIDGLDWTPP
ncbi:hypothetical protein [Ruicaihuangia caeni]|uniref:DUF2029 domain-containing protein n=1 Tax=Ruicaihuangia caeni TaxID=3042517 RepID=A0AAW6TE19_9MICO|nr:hypothetical protein [Klugiella sp. YN-L-19]MDI2099660.1 hypothetical protein [Klugiella sp. YN-L-19]